MKLKKIAAIVLAAVTAAGCIGCQEKTENGSLILWAEASTVKILQNDGGEASKQAGKKNILKINMAKNESEGVQLMMYAKKDVSSYNVTVSDLKSDAGTIKAEDMDVYALKYQTVEGNSKEGNPAFASGEIPDPMLPIATAVEYKETVIEKGENQSVFIDVETTKDTKPGTYTGTATVEADGSKLDMPIEVTVYDVTIPDTSSLKTAFSYFDRDNFATAEMDASDEQTRAYVDTLLDFNMSSWLPFEGEGEIEKYLEILKEYYSKPGFNNYRMYYDTTGCIYEGRAYRYNAALLAEYVKAIAKMSVEDEVNYLDKAYNYFYTVSDEPAVEEQFLTAKDVIDGYTYMLSICDSELREYFAGTEDYKYYTEVVSQTLLDIPYVLPGSYNIDQANQYGLGEMTYVPEISVLHTEAARDWYTEGREDKELWTYTCVGPIYPYPSAHTDDYCLGFRLTSWMCKDYDWDGFLMWGATDYLNLEYGNVIPDAWETMDTGQGRPGDGKYFYPGAKYGLDYPCPSIRAVAYRDGIDDYELLAAVEAIYEENGMEADAALQSIYDKVFSGVIPITDSDYFEEVRAEVFALIEGLKSDTGILYDSVNVGIDKAEMVFKTVNEKATVKVDDEKVTVGEDGFYRVTVDLTKQSESTIEVTCGKETTEYTRVFFDGQLGSVCSFDEGDAADYIFSSSPGYVAELSSDEKFAQDGKSSLHMQINKDGEDKIPYFAIEKASKLIGGSWKDITSMKFYLYNAAAEETEMNVTYYTTSEMKVNDYTLAPGEWTLIEIDMPTNLDDIDSIQEFDFNFAQGSKVELYMDSFVTVAQEGK